MIPRIQGNFCSFEMVVKASTLSLLHTTTTKVKTVFLNFYASILASDLFRDVTRKVVSLVFFDRGSEQKLTRAREILMPRDVNREQYLASSKFIASFVGEMLDDMFMHGPNMPRQIRPEWLDELVWQKPDGSFVYTLRGQIAHNLVRENRALIERYIELSLLQIFSRIAERIQTVQSRNVFISLEATQEILAVVTEHLSGCEGQNKPKAADSAEDIAQIIRMALELTLPDRGVDIELPIHERLEPYIKSFLFSLLENELLPQLVQEGLIQARSRLVKIQGFNQALTKVKENLSQEYRPEVPPSVSSFPPEKLSRLEDVLNACLTVSFTYLLNDYETILKSDLAVEKIAKAGAVAMVEKLPKIMLQEIVRTGLEELPEALSNVRFIHTLEADQAQKLKQEAKLRDEENRMVDLIRTTGEDPKRLFQLLQATLFFTNKPVYTPPTERSRWSGLTALYGKVTQAVAQKMVEYSSIQEFILRINQSASHKLFLAEHDRLYILVAKKVLSLISEKK
ncbi:MAG: hypothetical protein JSS12_02710 [Verrucomicrobia bacterium]|nr:hypothetical protein [Verrucomicrobiota bacterium]